jgi:acetolactate synthase-1/2/3 large subunit
MNQEGAKYLFGIPAGASRALYDELYDFLEIKPILTKHEQGAAFMADGYARASGKIGFCTSTVAPGAANLASGLLVPYIDQVPIIAVTTNEPEAIHGKTYIQDSSGWEPRSFNIIKHFETVTKWSYMLRMGERIQDVITRAIRIATTGRKGPVHINLPWDVTKKEVDVEVLPQNAYKPSGEPMGNPETIKKAAELLFEAESPSILAGGGVLLSNASAELMACAELLGAPVATTVMGKGAFPEDHPLALGVVGLWGQDTANMVIKKGETDVLLAIGCVFSQVTTINYSKNFGADKIIHIDLDAGEIGKNYPTELGIIGCAKPTLAYLFELLKEKFLKLSSRELERREERKRERLQKILKLKNELKYFSEPEMDSNAVPIKPQRAIKEIRKFLDRDAIVLADSGNNFAWAERYFQVFLPGRYIVDGLTHMGWSINAAIGVKLGAPKKQVLDICGNGSFQMTGKEVMTAVNYTIPVVWCILNDQCFSIIKQAQKYGWGLWDVERYIVSDFINMDFMKFAEACYAYGERVEKPEEIQGALKRAFNSGKPAIVEILTDPDSIPPGSFIRYEKVVKVHPELAVKRMPMAKFPIRILEGE